MDVSIIICTRDRASSLDRTIRSIGAMRTPVGLNWELVIVDNGSMDGTAQVIAAYTQALPIISVFEAQPGLSYARNAGVRKAQGQCIIWTDDDVEVHEDWLCAYVDAFAEFPEAGVFGGCVIPVFEGNPQTWFLQVQKLCRDVFSACDISGPCRPFASKDKLPVGANFAIRATEQKSRLYNPLLGVAPGRIRGGEETELIKTILREGGRSCWVPHSKVYHLVPASRQRLSYINRWYRAQGEKYALVRDLAGDGLDIFHLLKHLAKATVFGLLYFITRPLGAPTLWMRYYSRFYFQVGVMLYLLSSEHRELGTR